MVAEAIKSALPPVYELRSFRSRDALGALVGRARKALAREFDRELAELGLNTAQALVIVLLAEGVSSTAAGIGRELSHDPGAMTRMLDKLEDAGYVRRVPRPRDRRATDLELSAEGRRLHGEVRRVQVAVLNRMLRGFSRTEARTLERLLKRVLDNANGVE
ncbi:MAG TPA: MarR family transcriptional regulator [Burkholderiales bacterium]|nr:MarR family transcriptional regulator [Burkholderiales bacterium]